ncbi:hypothetical protein [Methanocella arvoryzae]|nr:hypothetical protein [Methanocella arvoryzae]
MMKHGLVILILTILAIALLSGHASAEAIPIGPQDSSGAMLQSVDGSNYRSASISGFFQGLMDFVSGLIQSLTGNRQPQVPQGSGYKDPVDKPGVTVTPKPLFDQSTLHFYEYVTTVEDSKGTKTSGLRIEKSGDGRGKTIITQTFTGGENDPTIFTYHFGEDGYMISGTASDRTGSASLPLDETLDIAEAFGEIEVTDPDSGPFPGADVSSSAVYTNNQSVGCKMFTWDLGDSTNTAYVASNGIVLKRVIADKESTFTKVLTSWG